MGVFLLDTGTFSGNTRIGEPGRFEHELPKGSAQHPIDTFITSHCWKSVTLPWECKVGRFSNPNNSVYSGHLLPHGVLNNMCYWSHVRLCGKSGPLGGSTGTHIVIQP